jgi:acetylornithine deacetylase/succinyl-diaminopimelate desuccinylase-like protein
MSSEDAVLAHVDAHLEEALERLFAFLRIPSVSADPDRARDCHAAALWLNAELLDLGFAASVHVTPGHPIVVAEQAGQRERRAVFYGHYDVQPADPLELWTTAPFEPRLTELPDGRTVIVARGASDDKGQIMTFLEACRAWRDVAGALPIGIRVLFEGAEETGSQHLADFIATHRSELSADVALICDTAMWEPGVPAIVTSVRGLVAEEIVITAANRNLHSGLFGGAARNPIHVLARIVADMHDADGRVCLPGFYDGVVEPSPQLAAAWLGLEETARRQLSEVGLTIPAGESGRSLIEQTTTRPTFDVCGIAGGYGGAGMKTVIPAKASAKCSFRLVPGQDPQSIIAAFRKFARERMPADCTVEFTTHEMGAGFAVPVEGEMLRAVSACLETEWGSAPVLVGTGGSIPVVDWMKTMLGLDTLMVGFALSDDQIHAPNERYALSSFRKGIRSWIRILAALANRNDSADLSF